MLAQDILLKAATVAIAAAQPGPAVKAHLPSPPTGRIVVVGAGKGAGPMARAVVETWPQRASGVVIAPYGHGHTGMTHPIRLLEARHPIPDTAGVAATREVLHALEGLTPDDLVLCLISGGGSALLTMPQGITLDQKAELTGLLLKSGATIDEINTVRKHLSGVKGGRLAAAAYPARLVSLIVSDVVGDDLSVIASGPTVPDPSTYDDALAVLDRYGLKVPPIRQQLESGAKGDLDESPKPDTPSFRRVENRLIATNAQALEAALKALTEEGIDARITSDRIESESRWVAHQQAGQARNLSTGQALVSGGETTVTVRGNGRGGPNLEFLLALAIDLEGAPGIVALAVDTDGIDGRGDAAGAIVTPHTLERAHRLGLDPSAMLENNDAYTFFDRLGDLVKTGPTGTNVNDIRILYHDRTDRAASGG